MISDVAKATSGAQSLQPGIPRVSRDDARVSLAMRRRIVRTGFILDLPFPAPCLRSVDQVIFHWNRVANNG